MASLLEKYNEKCASDAIVLAIKMDKNKCYTHSYHYYLQGIDMLNNIYKATSSTLMKEAYLKRINEYIVRAEKVKDYMKNEKSSGDFHETIEICEDSKGHDYTTLLGVYFSSQELTRVIVEEPYIQKMYQFYNFLKFCEMMISQKNKLSYLTLNTKPVQNKEVQSSLGSLSANLKSDYNITLDINYIDSLHDRKLHLNNGWIIKMGRGLNMFKSVNRDHIGSCDYSLRKCNQCEINIYYSKNYIY